jgi:hypothetical protein
MTFIVSAKVKNGVPQIQIFRSKELYRVVPQIEGLDDHFPDQLKIWHYDVIWWRNDVKSFPTRNKTHLFTPWVHVCPNAWMWVNACPNGEPESMYARMWGGLLQDIVSPLGDMVHFYLAKASFLQDMLLCLYVCYLAKASFLQDMLLCLFVILQKLAFCKICYLVCLFFFFFVCFFFCL